MQWTGLVLCLILFVDLSFVRSFVRVDSCLAASVSYFVVRWRWVGRCHGGWISISSQSWPMACLILLILHLRLEGNYGHCVCCCVCCWPLVSSFLMAAAAAAAAAAVVVDCLWDLVALHHSMARLLLVVSSPLVQSDSNYFSQLLCSASII